MSNITDRERRQTAYLLRCIDVSDLTPDEMDDGDGRAKLAERIADALCIGHAPYYFDAEPVVNRLADLIEPSDGFDLDAALRVCYEGMEGCGEPEWTLYTTVYDAICRYKRGESGRPIVETCDRDALLAIAREMDEFAYTPDRFGNVDKRAGRMMSPPMTHEFASRIREACGEVEE